METERVDVMADHITAEAISDGSPQRLSCLLLFESVSGEKAHKIAQHQDITLSTQSHSTTAVLRLHRSLFCPLLPGVPSHHCVFVRMS